VEGVGLEGCTIGEDVDSVVDDNDEDRVTDDVNNLVLLEVGVDAEDDVTVVDSVVVVITVVVTNVVVGCEASVVELITSVDCAATYGSVRHTAFSQTQRKTRLKLFHGVVHT